MGTDSWQIDRIDSEIVAGILALGHSALLAFVITGLVYHRHLALVVLVVLMVVGANLPAEKIAAVGYDSDYLLAALVAIVLMPLIRDL